MLNGRAWAMRTSDLEAGIVGLRLTSSSHIAPHKAGATTPVSAAETKLELVVIDSKRLRQAGITRLLDIWADAMGLTAKAVVPDALLGEGFAPANCGMVIISVGTASIKDAQHQPLIETVRSLMPKAPLIIISDREDPEEICAAFEQGAVGFLPTSIAPGLAFRALSFIRAGGSFFPPSALSVRLGETTVHRVERASDLTAKQEEVLDLLRHGHSNKTIARRLSMSEATVKVHVRRIIHKFGVANRTQLAVAAMKNGSVPAPVNSGESCESGDDNMTQCLASESGTQH
jgi:DNA-binding NarL/FixJ family response regulator